MKRHFHMIPVGIFLFSIIALVGCGDNRPAASGGAYIYNSTDETAEVSVAPTDGSSERTVRITPNEGAFVRLVKADTYSVTVLNPPSSYYEQFTVTAGDKTDMLFDIGSSARFSIVPTYHVPQSMPDDEARSEVDRIKRLGGHQAYYLETPASRHVLPRGIYYSFGDNIENVSRMTDPGKSVEIRYKLSVLND